MRVRMIEGVPYYPHVVRYRLSDGRRRRMLRWSPGGHFARESVARELIDRFGFEGIRPGSVSIRRQP